MTILDKMQEANKRRRKPAENVVNFGAKFTSNGKAHGLDLVERKTVPCWGCDKMLGIRHRIKSGKPFCGTSGCARRKKWRAK